MFTTAEKDTTICLKRLDEWVVEMVITQPCSIVGHCSTKTTFTINSLHSEISRLGPAKPKKSKKGAHNAKHETNSL